MFSSGRSTVGIIQRDDSESDRRLVTAQRVTNSEDFRGEPRYSRPIEMCPKMPLIFARYRGGSRLVPARVYGDARPHAHGTHVIPARLMEISRNVRRGFLGRRNERGHRVLNNALEPSPRRLPSGRRPVPPRRRWSSSSAAWTQVRRNCPTDSHNLSLSTALRAAKAELLTPRA